MYGMIDTGTIMLEKRLMGNFIEGWRESGITTNCS